MSLQGASCSPINASLSLAALPLSFFVSSCSAPPSSTLFPYTTLFRSLPGGVAWAPSAPLALRAVLGALAAGRSEEHTSELQSLRHLVCRLLLEKKKLPLRPIRTYSYQRAAATAVEENHDRSNEREPFL